MIKLKSSIFIFVILSALYFVTRLQNITSLPVFCDEAIYIRWSQLIKNVETLRFVPLSDGKQPLFMWLTVPFLKLFSDPLVAGRLVSVFAGYFIFLFLILTFSVILNYYSRVKEPLLFIRESMGKHLPLVFIPALIYIFLPFSFIFDRLALADNLLSLFGLISLFLILLLSKTPRLDLSMILGIVMGLAWLTKSPAIYFLFLSFLGFLLLSSPSKLYYPIFSIFISFSIYNLLRLGPQFSQIALRNQDYIWKLSDIIKHPLDPLIPHLKTLIVLYWHYLGPLFLVFIIFLKIKYFQKKLPLNRLYIFLFLFYLVPLFSNLVFTRVFTGRYFVFTNPSLILLISYLTFSVLKDKKVYLFLFLSLFGCLPFLLNFSFTPFKANLPLSESGYLNGWTSGWGIESVASYLISRSQNFNVIVGTEGHFGTLPDGLQIYTDSLPRLTIVGIDNNPKTIPENLIDARNYGDDVYLLLNSSPPITDQSILIQLSLIKSFSKPDGSQLVLYRLL